MPRCLTAAAALVFTVAAAPIAKLPALPAAEAKRFLAEYADQYPDYVNTRQSFPGETGGDVLTSTLQQLFDGAGPPERAWLAIHLGGHAEATFQWEKALRWYQIALDHPGDTDAAATARLGIARVMVASNPASAEASLAALAADPGSGAVAAQLRGRRALNLGDNNGALIAFREAIAQAVRDDSRWAPLLIQSALADLSLAAALADKLELAAGYGIAAGFGDEGGNGGVPVAMPNVMCDPAGGIDRRDRVVFDVDIDDDGNPSRASAVWSARPGSPATVAFGRQLRRWRWPDTDPRPTIVTRGVRLMMACAARGELFQRASDELEDADDATALVAWLASRDIAMPLRTAASATRLEKDSAELLSLEALHGLIAPQLVPVLISLARNPASTAAAASANFGRAFDIVDAAGAPLEASAFLRLASITAEGAFTGQALPESAIGKLADILARMTPASRGSSLGVYIQALVAGAQSKAGDPAAIRQFNAILAQPRDLLPENRAERRYALGYLSAIEDNAGHHAAADALRLRAGFDAICEQADTLPVAEGYAYTEDDYPSYVRRAEISGRTIIERQVAADGRTAGVHIVYAQPPLLFDKAATDPMRRATSLPPRRGGKPYPCYARLSPIRWNLKRYDPTTAR